MRGADVLELQTTLKARGLAVGPLDGQYGPATATAVGIFQHNHGIPADGVYGPKTAAALKSAEHTAPPPKTGESPGELALVWARRQLGTTEDPKESNMTPFGKWFGVNGVAWCSIFTSEAFEVGAGVTLGEGAKGAGIYSKGITYVPTLEAWLRTSGQWIGRSTPAPGDIAIYNWDGGVPDHVGIVDEYLGGGQFYAIEGNTAVGNDSNGGEVMRRLRYVSQADGFGRIR